MKKLLTIASITTAIALSSLAVYARGMGNGGNGVCGGAGGGGMGPGMGMNHLAMLEEYLDLTDEQADKIHKIDMDFRDRQYQQMKEHRKAIDKILTDEQKKKLEGLKNERREKNDGKGKHMNKNRHMGPAIDLTDDQIDRIHKINMDYADKFHKNRKNADELKKLRESRDKDMEKVFTKDQLEKLKEYRGKNRDGRDCPFFPEED